MSSVDLDTVLLGPADDLAAQIELDVSALDEDDSVDGEVRTYANGRRRSITRSSTSRTLPLSFDVVEDRELVEIIRSWRTRVLLYRDPRGRKVWCVFYSLQVKEKVAVDVAEVRLTLTEVTYDEAV